MASKKAKRLRWPDRFHAEKLPEKGISLEDFGLIPPLIEPKTLLKELLRFCNCSWCSIHWLKEYKLAI